MSAVRLSPQTAQQTAITTGTSGKERDISSTAQGHTFTQTENDLSFVDALLPDLVISPKQNLSGYTLLLRSDDPKGFGQVYVKTAKIEELAQTLVDQGKAKNIGAAKALVIKTVQNLYKKALQEQQELDKSSIGTDTIPKTISSGKESILSRLTTKLFRSLYDMPYKLDKMIKNQTYTYLNALDQEGNPLYNSLISKGTDEKQINLDLQRGGHKIGKNVKYEQNVNIKSEAIEKEIRGDSSGPLAENVLQNAKKGLSQGGSAIQMIRTVETGCSTNFTQLERNGMEREFFREGDRLVTIHHIPLRQEINQGDEFNINIKQDTYIKKLIGYEFYSTIFVTDLEGNLITEKVIQHAQIEAKSLPKEKEPGSNDKLVEKAFSKRVQDETYRDQVFGPIIKYTGL